eukprot:3381596-Prymnesium_polylepis.3
MAAPPRNATTRARQRRGSPRRCKGLQTTGGPVNCRTWRVENVTAPRLADARMLTADGGDILPVALKGLQDEQHPRDEEDGRPERRRPRR